VNFRGFSIIVIHRPLESASAMHTTPKKTAKAGASPPAKEKMPPKSVRADPLVAQRLPGGLSNCVAHRKALPIAIKEAYPEIADELFDEPLVETEAELEARMAAKYPIPVSLDDRYPIRTDAQYDICRAIANGPARDRQEEKFDADNRLAAREANARIESVKLVRTRKIAEELSLMEKKKLSRVAASAELLTSKYLDPALRAEVVVHADFDKTPGAHNSIRRIHRIVVGLLTGAGADFDRIAEANIRLQSLKQLNELLHVFTTVFLEAKAECEEVGSVMTEADYCQYYVRALSPSVFKRFKLEYVVPAVPDLDTLVGEVLKWYEKEVRVDPAVKEFLTGAMSRDFMAYALQCLPADQLGPFEDEDEVEDSAFALTSEDGVKCQVCFKLGHDAHGCWRLLDPKFNKELVAKIQSERDQREPRDKRDSHATRRRKKRDKASAIEETKGESASAVNLVSEIELFELGHEYEPERVSALIDWQHDDHATVHVMTNAALFDRVVECAGKLQGVMPGAEHQVSIERRGTLQNDFGRAVIMPTAAANLASESALCEHYHVESLCGGVRTNVHKRTGARLLFRKDKQRYGDEFYHATIEVEPLGVVSAVDFYNPAALPPFPDGKAGEELRAGAARAARLHWNTDHMPPMDMAELLAIEPGGHPEGVTASDVRAFVKHVGCSACQMGHMNQHAQFETSQAEHLRAGRAQGDIFFLEYGAIKIPVLLVVCEVTLFLATYVFLGAAARAARTKASRVMCNAGDIRDAVDAICKLWDTSGQSLVTLRFDNEAALASPVVLDYVRSKGVEPALTAAGQKLGLIEVSGRIFKDRGPGSESSTGTTSLRCSTLTSPPMS